MKKKQKKKQIKKLIQKKIQVKNKEMNMTSVNKVQFAYKDGNGNCKQSTVCKFK